jgi:hypothetical protein
MPIVYVRILVYVLSILAGLIPAGWAGFVAYNEAAGTITISIEGLAIAIVTGLGGSLAIFKKWGTR